MGKKKGLGTAPKALEARERRKNEKVAKQLSKQKAIEDEKWKEKDKKVIQKQQKAEEEKRKRDEALKRKQELREITRKEEEEAAKLSKSKGKVATAEKKVTAAQRAAIREKEAALARAQKAEAEALRSKVTQAPTDDDPIPENLNLVEARLRAEAEAEGFEYVVASGIDEAVGATTSGAAAAATVDKHPEKRMKAAFLAYEEEYLPRLKKENPSLRRTQLKDILWKQWQKAPENPLVARALAEL